MEWFNLYGLAVVLIMMIPNAVYAAKCKEGFISRWKNKAVEALEQVGRFGSFIFMIFNIPYTAFGFISDGAFTAYLVANAVLLSAYLIIWIVMFRKNTVFRALSLSILPSLMFLLSGILSRSILLIVFAVIFAPCHVAISYKNCR